MFFFPSVSVYLFPQKYQIAITFSETELCITGNKIWNAKSTQRNCLK